MKSGPPTKVCKKCGYVGTRFKGPNRSTSDGYDHICMDCVLDRRREIRQRNVDLLGRWKLRKGCAKCGYKEHAVALHLNHIDPSTKHKRGKANAYDAGWGKQRLKEELAKCEVLCANCHSVVTHLQNIEEGRRRRSRQVGKDDTL